MPLTSGTWAVSSHRPAHYLLRTVGCPTVKPFQPPASSHAAYELRTATLNRKSLKSVQSNIEAGKSSTHSKPTELLMYSKNPMFLEGRHKFDFLSGGTVRLLPGDALKRLWKGEDSLTRSMLINSMEPQIGKPLLYAARTKDLWDTTQTLYSKR
ncbi:UBN2_3 domain-containing protein [Cucumis melo var. makuwa]|uniref:UBN2_3 domain-containing protein n=1 Tax=Cucumis melo var. makuwa TaxID=1194695 RepID=A0A5A7U5W5_CUCMM|nr:UBN2_3 domain-containing protein [Cucumis melo var. makuwa]TYK28095.1 UBN2_3 domain-containing protein [Cucumis melo var. makuwa]